MTEARGKEAGSIPPGRVTGTLLSLAAAAAFGVLTPAGKGSLAELDPLRAAGLAYLAAGSVALFAVIVRVMARSPLGQAPSGRDLLRLTGMTLVGGVLGPALFFEGLLRIEAHHTAVLQHMEFALTILAAVVVLGERPGRKGAVGLVLVAAGIAVLSAFRTTEDPSGVTSTLLGIWLVVAACAAWACDNTLARGATHLDPLVVVSIKGAGAGLILTSLSGGARWPHDASGWGTVLLAGGVGIGLSLVLELMALRRVGAALNAGLFATGPAFGFLWSTLFLEEEAGGTAFLALAVCATGAVLLALDQHRHLHAHEALRHTHRHRHDDPHHDHAHDPGMDPAEEHTHEHVHRALAHSHPHVHDEHHRHRHRPPRRG